MKFLLKTQENLIENDTDRDNYLTANDAKDYGLVDKILTTVP